MSEERYSLNWRNHDDSFLSEVNNFFNSKFMTDIDLIFRDNKRIGCHKLILAIFSQFFYEVFAEKLYTGKSFAMVNVQYEDMKLLIDYMYTGEIKVSKTDLPRIIELVNFFQIKGFKENLPVELQQNGCVQQNGVHEEVPSSE